MVPWVPSLGREDPMEEEMATHTSILSWRIPWTEEPGGLRSWGRRESDTTEHTHAVCSAKTLEPHEGLHVDPSPVLTPQGPPRYQGAGQQRKAQRE